MSVTLSWALVEPLQGDCHQMKAAAVTNVASKDKVRPRRRVKPVINVFGVPSFVLVGERIVG